MHRLVILLIGCLLVVGLVIAGVRIGARRNEQRYLQKRSDGLAAMERGDYPAAVRNLSDYIGAKVQHQKDAEAILAFAKARMRVEEPDGSHIKQPIKLLQSYIELKRDDPEAQLEAQRLLLKLYRESWRNPEAIQLADVILARRGDDLEALQTKADALLRSQKYDEALATSQKINQLAPLNLEGYVLTIQAMLQLREPVDKTLAYSASLRSAHPDDPRFELLEGYVYLSYAHRAGDSSSQAAQYRSEAQKWLLKAAAHPLPDEKFAQMLASDLEHLALYTVDATSSQMLHTEAQRALEKALDSNNPQILRLLAQRLFYTGQFQKLEERLKDLDPQSKMSRSELLAYRALALYQLNRTDEARAIVDALAGRDRDEIAIAWAKGLRTHYGPYESGAMEPRLAIRQLQDALVRDPYNAVLRMFLAEVYGGLNEDELALEQVERAEGVAPAWALPYNLAARILLGNGRVKEAEDQASRAYRCLPSNSSLASHLLICQYAALDVTGSDYPQQLTRLLHDVGKFHELVLPDTQPIHDEPTLPVQVALLARIGQKDQATDLLKQLARRHQEARQQQQKGLSERSLLALVALSRENRLGMEAPLMKVIQDNYGMTPQVALAQAMNLWADGKAQEGLKRLRDVAQAQGNSVEFQSVLARYAELIRDPESRSLWIALGDDPANADNRQLQSQILEVPSLWPNRRSPASRLAGPDLAKVRDFMQRTIDRVHRLTTDEGLAWKMGRARWLMTYGSADREAAEAASILTEIVRNSPYQVRARKLLAEALENIGDIPGAIDHLKIAAQRAPNALDLQWDLARLLQLQGQFDESRSRLNALAGHKLLTPQMAAQVAELLARQGDAKRAIEVLERQPSEPRRDRMLAGLYAGQGRTGEAVRLYQAMIESSNPDPEALESAAEFYAQSNQLETARKCLSRIPGDAPALRDLLLARFEEHYGSPEEAQKQYQAATRDGAAQAMTWRHLVGFYLRRAQLDEAAAAAAEGLSRQPEDGELQRLKDLATQLRSVKDANGPELREAIRPLVMALSLDPGDAAAKDGWEAIRAASPEASADDYAAAAGVKPAAKALDALKPVADKHPQSLPLWNVLVNLQVLAGKPDAARDTLDRLIEQFPTSVEVAERAVALHAAARQWDRMLFAAKEWRTRTPGNPRRADLAIAEADDFLGRPAAAIDQVKPYVEAAKADPEHHADVLINYSRSLMLAGQDQEAADLLKPLVSKSGQWRIYWLSLTGIGKLPPERAQQWVEQAAALVSADAADEQLAVAKAWYELGSAGKSPDGFAKAIAILQVLANRPDASAQTLEMLASTAEQSGQFKLAMDSYRRALAKNPASAFSQNELAYLLLTHGTEADLPEARDLASKAVASPQAQAAYHDTLARVYLKQKQYAQAIRSFQTSLAMDANSLETQVGLGLALVEDKQTKKAAEQLDKIDRLLQLQPSPNPTLTEQIQSLRQRLQPPPSAAGN